MNSKQVIVMRKDLGMRKGKMVAQGAHASMKAILGLMARVDMSLVNGTGFVDMRLRMERNSALDHWINGFFAKVCVYVTSEEDLMELYEKSRCSGIPCALVEDRGLTEFKGAITRTCIAVGPGEAGEVDKITGHLPLL